MSTRRTSSVQPKVEVQLGRHIYVSNVLSQVEVQLGKHRYISNVLPQIEVKLGRHIYVSNVISQIEVKIPTVDVTPEWITGFEHGVGSANGNGLFGTFQAGCSIVNTTTHSGTYACRVNVTASTAYFDKVITASGVLVQRFYFNAASLPAIDNAIIFRGLATTNDAIFGYKASTNKFYVVQAGGTIVESTTTVNTDQWYMVELRCKWNSTTHTIEWKINGISQTQYSLAGQSAAETFNTVRYGNITNTATVDYYFDDLVVTITNQDYPIGAGGTLALTPNADGTHVAGTVIKDENGNTINGTSFTAYNKLNSIPISEGTTYIKQTGTGTGNYADIQFTDLPTSIPNKGIIGVMALLAYTATDANANTGGAVVYHNNQSSSIWGGAGSSLQDYSDGSTADPFYKSVLVVNANNPHKVNDLRARIGYSNDVTPNPYWLNVILEVAYVWSPEGSAFSKALDLSQGSGVSISFGAGQGFARAYSGGTAESGPVIEEGEGVGLSISSDHATGMVISASTGQGLASGQITTTTNIETSQAAQATLLTKAQGTGLIDISVSPSGTSITFQSSTEFVDSFAELCDQVISFGSCSGIVSISQDAESLLLGHADADGDAIIVGQAYSISLTHSQAESVLDIFGRGTQVCFSRALLQAFIETGSDGEAIALTRVLPLTHISTYSLGRAGSLSLQRTTALSVSVGRARSVLLVSSITAQYTEIMATAQSRVLTEAAPISFVDVLSTAMGIAFALKIKLYVDPDIVHGVSYVRTSITDISLVRTALTGESVSRNSLSDTSHTKTSITDQSYTRTKITGVSHVRELKHDEEEL